MFPAKLPREVKVLIEQIKSTKLTQNPNQKYDKLKMTRDEFVRSFVSDQVLGPVNLACKKMIDGKTQVPAELIFMPCDFLYAIFNRSVKEYEHKAYFHQVETEQEFYERKNDIITRERTTKGLTLGFKIEATEVMIEVPVHRDRDFLVLMNTVLIPSGAILFQRRLYGMLGRKSKLVLTQRFKVIKSKNNVVKPIFVHLPKDILNQRRAKIVSFIDFDEIDQAEVA